MEIIKKRQGVKCLLFLVLQVCIISFLLSGITVMYNLGDGWYSAKDEQVKETIINEVASKTSYFISNQAGYDNWSHVYGFLDGYDEAEGFAFEVLTMDDETIYAVNTEKFDDEEFYLISDVYNVYDDAKGKYYEARIDTYWKNPINMGPDVSLGYNESMEDMYKIRCMIYEGRYICIGLSLASLVAAIILLVVLVRCTGQKDKEKSLINRFPADVVMVLCIIAVIIAVYCAYECLDNYNNYYQSKDSVIAIIIAIAVLISSIVTGFILFMSSVLKRGGAVKNSLIFRFGSLLIKLFGKILCALRKSVKKLPMVWRTVLILIAGWIVNLILALNMWWSELAVISWFIGALVVSTAIIYIALCMKRLKMAAMRIASGDLEYKVDKKGLFLDFAEHADNLNSIGDGMSAAIEERLRSERFKAELITNVSHDIKTPLTSIINYVDLIKKENVENEKLRNYIEVLDRQSQRLKKLTEDIVDASKASTGNVKMELGPCKVGLLITQTLGEYKERAEKEGLNFIVKMPEEELEILADGRRLWRVFDNLLNNVCKYGQPGTRVYVSLEEECGEAVITYRNVSKYELDISADELMERFVRGDKARNTAGSGLGLSIARDLVELQDGSFDVSIDGDLFKAIMKFKLINL